MPANLTPEYLEADRAYREAKTPEDKLRCLEHMLSVIPKHKGTDKLQADLKSKIAKLQRGEGKKVAATSRRSAMFNVAPEGAGQVAMAGAPNSGKSSLLGALTKAEPEIADYPYTTIKPQPGMIQYQNIQIQLVDLPPIGVDFTESWVPGVIRNADLALIVVNLGSNDVLDETDFVLRRLDEGKVRLVDVIGQRFHPDGTAEVKARMVASRMDLTDAPEVLELVREAFGARFKIIPVSVHRPEELARLAEAIFHSLELVRVYTKKSGKEADLSDPVILPLGSTVLDFARSIHKDLASQLKFARIWGKNKFEGQRVPREYQLQDEDIIELHN